MGNITTIAIIANGELRANNELFTKLSQADCIICADGGTNYSKELNITPHYIIGDMDSIKPELLKQFKENTQTKVIYNPDQDKTDLELAIELANSLKPKQIIFFAALGKRLDHTIANILSLRKVNNNITTSIYDAQNEVWIVEDSLEIDGKRNHIISTIALSDIKGLSYGGLKWTLDQKTVPSGWIGICNRMLGERAKISLQSGTLLVMKIKEY